MRIQNSLLLLSLSLLLTSCNPGTQVEITNNTGQDLTVISMDTKLKQTAYSVASSETVRIKVPYKLRVQRDRSTWNYELPSTPLPENFRKRVRGNWYLEKFQIEREGAIYVLLPDAQTPEVKLPPQPGGFPIQPK